MIKKMLTLNISHIRKKTIETLENDSTFNKFECLETLKYGNHGYIININARDFETYNRFNQDMPADLQTVVAFAIDYGCDVLCLTDLEKHPLFYLPRYEYVSRPDEFGEMSSFEDCYCGGQLMMSTKLDEFGDACDVGPKTKNVRDYFGKKV